jgi:hypothetical protein
MMIAPIVPTMPSNMRNIVVGNDISLSIPPTPDPMAVIDPVNRLWEGTVVVVVGGSVVVVVVVGGSVVVVVVVGGSVVVVVVVVVGGGAVVVVVVVGSVVVVVVVASVTFTSMSAANAVVDTNEIARRKNTRGASLFINIIHRHRFKLFAFPATFDLGYVRSMGNYGARRR